jgi:hypothetical protein
LADYPRQYKVPTLAQLEKRGGSPLNLTNIQGDILYVFRVVLTIVLYSCNVSSIGMKKPGQLIYFFQINDVKGFKQSFKKNIIPLITSVYQMADVPANQPESIVNVAFTHSGLKKLGVKDDLKDSYFSQGQFVDAYNLGDGATNNWVPSFKGTATHGVFIISRSVTSIYSSNLLLISINPQCSDEQENIDNTLAQIQTFLTNSTNPPASELHRVLAVARPGAMKGHERASL